jgi:hypothetical protein
VLMQEHVMSAHGYTSTDLRNQTRETLGPDHYRYSMPDGVAWLEAWKVDPEDHFAGISDQELKAEVKRRSDAREHKRINDWLDQEDHTLPNERTDLCTGGCSWGTDGKFHHHPYCRKRAFEDGHLKQEANEQVQAWLKIAGNNLRDSAKDAKR